MPDFYVVSKVSENATDYESAVVFNNPAKEADNEAAANEYLDAVKAAKPWQHHSTVGADEWEKSYASDKAAPESDQNPAPSDPAPQS